MNFFSVSEDGSVCQWILMQNELMKVVRMSLVIDMYPEIELGGIKQTYYGNAIHILLIMELYALKIYNNTYIIFVYSQGYDDCI